IRRRTRDGTVVVVSLSGRPLFDAHNNVKGVIKFLTDITKQKQSEEAVRLAEQKYRSIFENAPEGIYQATPDGKYLSANPALVRVLGFGAPEELTDAHAPARDQQYVNPEMHTEFIRLMNETGAVKNFEYQVYRKDRSIIWVSESAHIVRNSQ